MTGHAEKAEGIDARHMTRHALQVIIYGCEFVVRYQAAAQ